MLLESRGRGLILAVDDEPAILADLATVLGMAGYCCVTASDAPTALELATHLAPALVISDINLAGESGFELCEQIKQRPALVEIPVVFLSGAQIPDVVRAAHAVGGTYYLRKPFDPEVLEELVEKALWMPHLVKNRLHSTPPRTRAMHSLTAGSR